jgi:hypothetical protein
MPPKKKSKWRVEREARRRARLGIGMPPAARTIPDKRSKPVKHKKTLPQILTEE